MKFSNNRGLNSVQDLWRDESGTAALESSIVFPLIFAGVVAMMLLALIVYQQAVVYYSASVTGERAAFNWDNSFRSPDSGMLEAGKKDGLYWRLSEDGLLEAVFGRAGESATSEIVELPEASGGSNSGQSLSQRKMAAAAALLPSSYTGQIHYKPSPLIRTVSVNLKLSAVFIGFGTRTGGEITAGSTVVDPVEFVRSIDLARYYAGKFGSGQDAASKRARASEVLKGRMGGG